MNQPQPTSPERTLDIASDGLLTLCCSDSLQYLTNTPTLIPAERAAFNNTHPIAYVTLIAFIVRFDSAPAFQILSVFRVHDGSFKRNYDGLFHPVANNR